eukprot:760720-Hanusia_phi.AAC.1
MSKQMALKCIGLILKGRNAGVVGRQMRGAGKTMMWARGGGRLGTTTHEPQVCILSNVARRLEWKRCLKASFRPVPGHPMP